MVQDRPISKRNDKAATLELRRGRVYQCAEVCLNQTRSFQRLVIRTKGNSWGGVGDNRNFFLIKGTERECGLSSCSTGKEREGPKPCWHLIRRRLTQLLSGLHNAPLLQDPALISGLEESLFHFYFDFRGFY